MRKSTSDICRFHHPLSHLYFPLQFSMHQIPIISVRVDTGRKRNDMIRIHNFRSCIIGSVGYNLFQKVLKIFLLRKPISIPHTSCLSRIGAADSAYVYCVPAALRLHSNAFYVAGKGIGTGFWEIYTIFRQAILQ